MIDAHVHVWTLDPERYPWQPILGHVPVPTKPATIEALLGQMDSSGVTHALLVQPSVYGWNNAYLCDTLTRYAGRCVGVCLVDPRSGRAGDDLLYWCRERGCRGLRVNTIGDQEDSNG